MKVNQANAFILAIACACAVASSCPAGDVGTTIGGSEYCILTQQVTQPEAQAQCAALGASLASITSPQDNAVLNKMVLDFVNCAAKGGVQCGAAWLGLERTRTATGSRYTNADGTPVSAYMPWSFKGKDPNYLEENSTAAQACVLFGSLAPYLEDGTWGDAACSELHYPLCKAPATTTKKKKSPLVLVIGGIAGGVGAVAVVATLLYVMWRLKRHLKPQGEDGSAIDRSERTGADGGGGSKAANASNGAKGVDSARLLDQQGAPGTAPKPPPAPLPTGVGTPLPPNYVALPGTGASGMPASMALPAVAICLIVAKEILDAGDRVVGNQVRCKRITRRIALLTPMLQKLQAAIEGNTVVVGDMSALVDQIHEVMRECKEMVLRWGSTVGGSLGVLRAMIRSRDYEREFLDLNQRLGEAMHDLGLRLHIEQVVGGGSNKQQVEREVEADTVKDLQQLAAKVAADPHLLDALTPQERQTLDATYREQGLDLQSITAQLKLQAKKAFIDAQMGNLMIRWQDIELGDKIGAGGYGEVYLARWQNQTVAVKVLQVGERTALLVDNLRREAYIMSQLRHPNVAMFYGMVLEREACALVMAYYPRGTLMSRLQDGAPLNWPTRLGYALDVANGMMSLHNRPFEPIVHGDLKPSNLLLLHAASQAAPILDPSNLLPPGRHQDSRRDHVVITDFGLSRVQNITATARTGAHSSALSVVYAAPELINNPNRPKTQASDVYSFGILLYEIGARQPPFLQGGLPNAVMNFVGRGGRPAVPEGLPEGYAELMEACWAQEPAARPAFDEVVKTLVGMLQGAA